MIVQKPNDDQVFRQIHAPYKTGSVSGGRDAWVDLQIGGIVFE